MRAHATKLIDLSFYLLFSHLRIFLLSVAPANHNRQQIGKHPLERSMVGIQADYFCVSNYMCQINSTGFRTSCVKTKESGLSLRAKIFAEIFCRFNRFFWKNNHTSDIVNNVSPKHGAAIH